MQIDDAPVTAELLPGPDGLGERRSGERFGGRKSRQEALVERDGSLYLYLLQHYLGDEHPPGVAGAAPRQVPRAFLEPGDQSLLDLPALRRLDAHRMPAPFAHPGSLRSLALTTSASLHKDGSLLLRARVDHKSGKWLPARFDVRGHVFGHVPIRITRSGVHHVYLCGLPSRLLWKIFVLACVGSEGSLVANAETPHSPDGLFSVFPGDWESLLRCGSSHAFWQVTSR